MTKFFSQPKLNNKEQKDEWQQALNAAEKNKRSTFEIPLKGKTIHSNFGKKSSHVGQLSGPKWRRGSEVKEGLREYEEAKAATSYCSVGR